MKKCWIFGSAQINDYSKLIIDDDTFIIAADGGYSHIKKMGRTPDLIIGDFDSLNIEKIPDIEVITVPAEKDDTDMMLCVKTAIERGFDDITLCGALGGRLDHTIANIQTLEYINAHGAEGRIVDINNEAYLLTSGSYNYLKKENWYFSIFSLSSTTEVTTTGTKFNLTNHKLSRQFPLGISNEITEDICGINVFSGVLLVIFSQK